MTFEISLLNFILNVAIIVVGFLAYQKSKNFVPLYLAGAFVLFSITHLLTLLGMAETLLYPILVIRTVAYLTIIFTLYKLLTTSKKK
ncbi:hypothetical protein KKB44_00695 [Candidatus Micrarchaeota archaeon]|nr:hypothetical protein [Candidatus Micrarchaeota archaeon]